MIMLHNKIMSEKQGLISQMGWEQWKSLFKMDKNKFYKAFLKMGNFKCSQYQIFKNK